MSATFGKAWGLRRLADSQGRFKMLAIDQRPQLAQLIATACGNLPQEARFEDMCAVKRVLAEELASRATAILVDPNFAYPARNEPALAGERCAQGWSMGLAAAIGG